MEQITRPPIHPMNQAGHEGAYQSHPVKIIGGPKTKPEAMPVVGGPKATGVPAMPVAADPADRDLALPSNADRAHPSSPGALEGIFNYGPGPAAPAAPAAQTPAPAHAPPIPGSLSSRLAEGEAMIRQHVPDAYQPMAQAIVTRVRDGLSGIDHGGVNTAIQAQVSQRIRDGLATVAAHLPPGFGTGMPPSVPHTTGTRPRTRPPGGHHRTPEPREPRSGRPTGRG